MCVLTVANEDKVPSRLKLLLKGVSFLLTRDKIHSSAALDRGIVSTSYLCTHKSRPKARLVVPGCRTKDIKPNNRFKLCSEFIVRNCGCREKS